MSKQKDPTPKNFQEIRDKLYVLILKEHEKVKEAYKNIKDGDVLQGRNADIFYPLLSIAKLAEDEALYE